MTIETKFNKDDSVYVMYNNKIEIRKISSITIVVGKTIGLPNPYIKYGFKDLSDTHDLPENKLFKNFNGLCQELQKHIMP